MLVQELHLDFPLRRGGNFSKRVIGTCSRQGVQERSPGGTGCELFAQRELLGSETDLTISVVSPRPLYGTIHLVLLHSALRLLRG